MLRFVLLTPLILALFFILPNLAAPLTMTIGESGALALAAPLFALLTWCKKAGQ